ncbi:aldo/keto reductase family protein [Aspergillus lucknowensis]|uniref:NADP-dependent oxidoreductase domain-containing protein n=1 Tax=Aspergillus lucknowensis TaxID=176173 RepID=A0ABR4LFM1_9EURO
MPSLAGKQVGSIGLGLMGLTWRETLPSQDQAFATLRAAIANGCTCWNGAEFYGAPEYNSLVLLERYFAAYPEDADKVVLTIKGGINPDTHQLDASPANTRRTIDDCLAQLKGRKKIDVFQFGRRDPKVPLEVTFGVMKEYIDAGKIGGIGLSEVRAETIHEAVKHADIAAVEAELSMFSPDILDNGVAAACAQYGIPIIAYSPMGRGILTGQVKFSDIPADSLLLKFGFPRFQEANFEKNVPFVKRVMEVAARKGCTPGQLAVSWTVAQARRLGPGATIVPIPGSSTPERVAENGTLVDVTDDELEELDGILKAFTIAGERWPPIFETNT